MRSLAQTHFVFVQFSKIQIKKGKVNVNEARENAFSDISEFDRETNTAQGSFQHLSPTAKKVNARACVKGFRQIFNWLDSFDSLAIHEFLFQKLFCYSIFLLRYGVFSEAE